ncbi:hypothetical protein N602_00150, partial [Mycobacterium avium subsp. hominissuis 10-5606]
VARARPHARRNGGRVVVASYLLADGLFQQRLHGCGADLVSAPLSTHPGLARLIANRFRRACRRCSPPPPGTRPAERVRTSAPTRPPRGRFLDLCPTTGDPDTMPRREEPSHGLLDPVAKMLRLPFGTPEFIDRIVTGGVNQVGRRTLRMLITTWDAAGGGPFAASAIASTGMAKTAEIVQGMFIGPVFGPLLRILGADKVAVRASLCASQLVGLGIMRYGIRSEPLHSMSVDAIVDAIGPTVQRYLVGDITR